MSDFFQRLEATKIGNHFNNEVVGSAYQRLQGAATLPNPILPYVVDILQGADGLSRKEISLLLAYTQFRSAPTIAEIGSLGVLLARQHLPDSTKTVLSNLADEVLRGSSHVHLLYSGISAFGNGLKVPVLGHFSLNVTKLFLQARRDMEDQSLEPDQETIALLKEQDPNNPIFKMHTGLLGGTFDACVVNHSSTISDFLKILPANCDVYERVVEGFCNEDFVSSDQLSALSSGLIRLALRESSSAGADGVVGIHQSVTAAYAGYFERKVFRNIAKWADVHIGSHGVEDAHKEDAIRLAVNFAHLLDPEQLASVFNREALLVETRNDQARAFVDRMKTIRPQAEQDEYIPPRSAPQPASLWRNILAWNIT
ncbi:MAG TPA: hypothetical protein DCM27_02110 [Rhodospirillaceae bacterium]|nr:hypothetical protein [Rhodospirillaceae bacterium]